MEQNYTFHVNSMLFFYFLKTEILCQKCIFFPTLHGICGFLGFCVSVCVFLLLLSEHHGEQIEAS